MLAKMRCVRHVPGTDFDVPGTKFVSSWGDRL